MPLKFSSPASGSFGTIGQGFEVQQYLHTDFPGRMMSPIVLVDHFRMWLPTFDAHPHAGMSAVTLVFEDTVGTMQSLDSTGRTSEIAPGDLHWTLAGRGIVHTQQPLHGGSHIHALQIFVNLPAALKSLDPRSFRVARADMPRLELQGAVVTVVAGRFGGLASPAPLPQDLTMLEVTLAGEAPPLTVPLAAGWNAVVLAIDGPLTVGAGGSLSKGQAVAISATVEDSTFMLAAPARSRAVILSGPQIDEPLIQQGPFVMHSREAMAEVLRAYRAGEFGRLPKTGQ